LRAGAQLVGLPNVPDQMPGSEWFDERDFTLGNLGLQSIVFLQIAKNSRNFSSPARVLANAKDA
jgi:hypothetical protein